ncbi:phage GP46 family protein [Breznakiella homolactica]|uniref:Phage GP46 family protein n=1 Tax=Breznakiella homolactica TaxID=2798577 RepID=A0A7T7XPW5_9SPIR|nr:phage GP46 family protein [Breznakiella homolactica]QQO10315.1 phage GP46 family protein [Breznakiella homolactica]
MTETSTVKLEQWTDIRELVLMCIGTDKGTWWGDPTFGSELWKLRQTGKVDGKTTGMVQQMILDCLWWLKEDGLAAEISCEAFQAGKDTIAYSLQVSRPDGTSLTIKDVWNGI